MYRLSEELAKELLKKIKNPEVISFGQQAFTFSRHTSVGIIDPICSIGTDFEYSLECPVPIIYPELPFIPVLNGYFLYRRHELSNPMEPWEITRVLVDPNAKDYEEKLDVRDCAVMLASDVDKLTAPTITTMEQLLAKEPALIDCLNLGR